MAYNSFLFIKYFSQESLDFSLKKIMGCPPWLNTAPITPPQITDWNLVMSTLELESPFTSKYQSCYVLLWSTGSSPLSKALSMELNGIADESLVERYQSKKLSQLYKAKIKSRLSWSDTSSGDHTTFSPEEPNRPSLSVTNAPLLTCCRPVYRQCTPPQTSRCKPGTLDSLAS